MLLLDVLEHADDDLALLRSAALRAELRQITEAQRERSTTYLQDERKRVKDRMWKLKCEEMERRR